MYAAERVPNSEPSSENLTKKTVLDRYFRILEKYEDLIEQAANDNRPEGIDLSMLENQLSDYADDRLDLKPVFENLLILEAVGNQDEKTFKDKVHELIKITGVVYQ